MMLTISTFWHLANASYLQRKIVSPHKVTHLTNFLKYSTAPTPTLFEGERKICIDGISLNVREEGSGEHNVLCLPGLVGTTETDFGKLFDKMDKSKRLIAWDPPGYGKSRPPQKVHVRDYFLSDALVVTKLMETLNYNAYSILGWSNGGVTGYAVAAKFPERVRNLVVWGSPVFLDGDLMSRISRLTDTSAWIKEPLEQMTKIYGKDCLDSMLSDFRESICEWAKGDGSQILKDRCSKVQCPVLVVHGEKDVLVPIQHAQYSAKNMKNCKMHVVFGGAHDLHLTHTKEFLDLVENFLLNRQ